MFARALTQAEVAQRLGVHTSNVSRIMSGKDGLSPGRRRLLAHIFGCSEADFLSPVGSSISITNH